jgi:hypothetical protein
MSSPEEINKFMKENEEFLTKVLRETGRTNLSEYFLIFLRDKAETERRDAQPKDLMMPPSLI